MSKRKVLIVFADGSKQMAHNTDDLKLRWYERKVVRAREVDDELYSGIPLPIYDFPQDREWAIQYQAELKELRMGLMQRASIAQEQRMPENAYRSLVNARMQVEAKLGLINKKVKEFNVAALANSKHLKQERPQSTPDLRDELINAQTEIIRLQRLLIEQFGLPDSVVYIDSEVQS